MIRLPFDNSRCQDALIIVKAPCNKTTIVVLSILSLLLMGGGLYGHCINPAMWGSYVILGVGGAGALIVLAALALKLVKTKETLVELRQLSQAEPKRQQQPTLQIPNLPALPRVMLNIRTFKDVKEQGPLITELRSLSFDFLERLKDIINAALVCKSFYNEIFANDNCRNKLERSNFVINETKRTTKPVRDVFGEILKTIPMVKDVEENPLLFKAATDWPFDAEKCRALLPIFKREQSPIIKGFFSNDRLFIAVRYKYIKKGKKEPGKGVFVFFQYESHTHVDWQHTQAFFKQNSGPRSLMRLTGGCLSESSRDEFFITNALYKLVQEGSVDSFKLWEPQPASSSQN